jgi:hypothetical protein
MLKVEKYKNSRLADKEEKKENVMEYKEKERRMHKEERLSRENKSCIIKRSHREMRLRR